MGSRGVLRVKNWETFQHYKDRNPPWIKLHRALLTDYEFACLQDASKLHLMLIWLLASQTNNEIPNDPKYLQKMLHLDDEPDLNELIKHGFLENASNVLAPCKQSAMPETETETETETEVRRKKKFVLPDTVDPEVWQMWDEHRRAGKKSKEWTSHAKTIAANRLKGLPPQQQRKVVEDAISAGWTGLFVKESSKPSTPDWFAGAY